MNNNDKNSSRYTASQVRTQLSKVNLDIATPHLRRAHECYMELDEEHRENIDYILAELIKAFRDRAKRQYKNPQFGPVSALEFLYVFLLNERKIKLVRNGNGSAPEKPRPLKVITRCRKCGELIRSISPLVHCPFCWEYDLEVTGE